MPGQNRHLNLSAVWPMSIQPLRAQAAQDYLHRRVVRIFGVASEGVPFAQELLDCLATIRRSLRLHACGVGHELA